MFAARRLHDRTAAEDVVQDTLARVLKALGEGRLEKPDALPAFVFHTARHVCQQRTRSAVRRDRALERLGGQAVAGPVDPLSRLIGAERRAEVRRALTGLGESDVAVLRMFFDEGLGTDDVAGRLGLSQAAVRARKHRALERLGKLLGDEPQEDLDATEANQR